MKKEEGTTGSPHEHCFCLRDTIGRPLCCKCYGVLLPDGKVQMLEGIEKELAAVREER